MSLKRLVAVTGTLIALLYLAPAVPAAQPKDQAAPAAPETGKKKEEKPAPATVARTGNWFTRLPLYLEVYAGDTGADDLDASVSTVQGGATSVAVTALSLDSMVFARMGIGWRLPENKGRFLLRLNAFKEDSYSLASEGFQSAAFDSRGYPNTGHVIELIRWWSLSIDDGRLTASRMAPVWEKTGVVNDDANDDDIISQDEVRYPEDPQFNPDAPGADTPNLVVDKRYADDLQNRIQVLDLTYGREFGGRKWKGAWTGGLRYFVYKGTVVTPAWVQTSPVGVGYTGGAWLQPLGIFQDTSGLGPTGSLEVQRRFARDRFILFAQGHTAFLVQSVAADTGTFRILVSDPTFPLSQRLRLSEDKSAWQPGVELGFRVRIMDGLHIEGAYHYDAFEDVIILPSSVQLPELTYQINLVESAAVTRTQDLRIDGWHLGLNYQF